MISSRELREQYDPLLLAKACCPLCLSSLCHRQGVGELAGLECMSCGAIFPVMSRLPIFLLDDENWAKKGTR